jgi:hypothetical protein
MLGILQLALFLTFFFSTRSHALGRGGEIGRSLNPSPILSAVPAQ